MQGWYLYVVCSIVALLLGIIFLLMMKMCAGCLSTLVLIAVIASLISIGTALLYSVYHTGPLNQSFNAMRVKYLSFIQSYKTQLVILAIFFLIAALVLIVTSICKRKSISKGHLLIKMASGMAFNNCGLLLLSVVIVVLQVCVFFFEIYVMLRIYTSGEEIHEEKDGNPFVHYDLSSWNKFQIFMHCFGTYWLIIVLNNFNDYVCSAVTVNNYFSTN